MSSGDEVFVTRFDHDENMALWLALQDRGVIVRRVDFAPLVCVSGPALFWVKNDSMSR